MANCTQCGKRVGVMPGVCPACLDSADPSWREESAHVRQSAPRSVAAGENEPQGGAGLAMLVVMILLGTALIGSDGGKNWAGGFGLGAIFAVSFLVYFAPAIVASRNAHPDKGAIFVLNLLLGWLFIPWVIALVWANRRPAAVVVLQQPQEPEIVERRCPHCDEAIRPAAMKCKHCGEALIPYATE